MLWGWGEHAATRNGKRSGHPGRNTRAIKRFTGEGSGVTVNGQVLGVRRGRSDVGYGF